MSGLPPVDLASAFGAPARSAGLTGLLPAKEPARPDLSEDPVPEQVETPATPSGRKNPSKQPAPTAAHPTAGRPRAVIVYVTPQQQRWIREQVAPGRTLTDVALDALEAHQERLAPPSSTPSQRPSLFTRSPRPAPQPGVQIQLRMTPSNVQVLDQLKDELGFDSRSALIRAALAAAEEANETQPRHTH